jgi:hypothetical protein
MAENQGKKTAQLSLKEIMLLEYKKCASDPIHFMRKYVYIQAEEGRTLFHLFKYQEKLLNLFEKYDRNIIVKSRQLGITTLAAGYALWILIFQKDKKVVSLAPTQEKARFIVDKVAFAYDNLPSWLKVDYVEKNKLSITLKNGSSIRAASGASDSARGLTAHLLILDEAAFIDNAGDLWGSAQQTLTATNGKAIVLSTPNGVGNWFNKMYVAAENGENDFIPIKLPWTVHPKRDQAWRDTQTKELGDKLAKQECDGEFSASGDTVVDPDVIKYYEDNMVQHPVDKRGPLKDLWVWKYADYTRQYAVIADIARGDGKDYSTFHVMDIEANEQVAEYKGQIDTKEFPKMLIGISYEYNEAMLIIERESVGWGVVKDVVESQYRNLYYSPKGEMVMDAETYLNRNYDNDPSKMTPGFSTNVGNRTLIVNGLATSMRYKDLIIRSKRFTDECRTFIWGTGNKPQAQSGFNDDLFIPMGIYVFLRDTVLRFRKDSQTLSMSALNGITRIGGNSQGFYPGGISPEKSWRMDVNGNSEDISWLIK